jgi:hypothetical protein
MKYLTQRKLGNPWFGQVDVGLYVEEIVWIALNCIQIGSNGGIL